MRILALDLATKTGWAIIGDDGSVIESGVQDFSKRRGESNGLMYMRFRKWLAGMHLMADGRNGLLIGYERPHHRGGAATSLLNNLAGRVEEHAATHNAEYFQVPPNTLKKWATGKGNCGKLEIMEKASEIVGYEITSDDEADAIMIGLYGFEQYCVANHE